MRHYEIFRNRYGVETGTYITLSTEDTLTVDFFVPQKECQLQSIPLPKADPYWLKH
jgi:hypothetical protein